MLDASAAPPDPMEPWVEAMHAALAQCASPGAIRSVVERVMNELFERSVVLQVKGASVILPDAQLTPATLALAIRTRAHSFGVWPDDAPHRQLLAALGWAPACTLTLPICIDDRVVLLAVATHNDDDVAAARVATALHVAVAAGDAFAALLRRRKHGSEHAVANADLPIDAAVSWAGAIAEAELAATTEPSAAALLEALETAPPEEVAALLRRLLEMGNSIDEQLANRFPGMLTFDPLDAAQAMPPLPACSRLLGLLAARGAAAAPIVVPHLQSPEPTKRLAAVYFLMSYPYRPALRLLAGRLYDTEPRIRYLAADALRAHAHEPAYEQVVAAIREQLSIPIAAVQLGGVQLLGQLRDAASVASLIALLSAPDATLRKAAQSALTVICGHLDSDSNAWGAWWKTHRLRHRIEWLLEALRDHRAALRQLADYELQLASRTSVDFAADAPEPLRAAAITRWEHWWAEHHRTANIL